MSMIHVNDVRLFYELSGSSGDPLVFVHGSWVDHHAWDEVVPFLSRSFQVLTYDRRGHSQSERPASPGSVGEDAGDLAALIEALDLAPAHIVGNSIGASIVLRLAVERPDLFRSMIVHEPPLFALLAGRPQERETLRMIQERIAEVVDLLEAGDLEGGVRQFVETIAFGPGAWAQVPPQLRQTVIFNAPTFLDEMHDPEALTLSLARLGGFYHPALLTASEKSPPFFAPIVDQIAAALPRAGRKTYLGLDHEPEQGDLQLYIETLTEFISRIAVKS